MAVIRKDFRYKVVKNFFNETELKLLQTYCLKALDDPSSILSQRTESSFAIAFSQDQLMETLLQLKKEIVEKECGLDLWKTYSYWRWYGFGSHLKNHRDRPACEISVTACITKTDDWPLTIKGKEIELDQGDGLLYLGTEESHGRVGIYKGDGLAQVFMHYVDKSGPFTHHADDNYTSTTYRLFSPEDKEYLLKLGIEGSW